MLNKLFLRLKYIYNNMKSNIRKFKFVKPVIKNPRDQKELIKEINKIKADEEVKRIKTEMIKANEDLNDYTKKKRDEEKDERLVRSYFDKNIMSTTELGPEQYDKLIELSKANPKAFREMMDNKILRGMDKQLDAYKRVKQSTISYEQYKNTMDEVESANLLDTIVKQTNDQVTKLEKDTNLTTVQIVEAIPNLKEFILDNVVDEEGDYNTTQDINKILSESGFKFLVRPQHLKILQSEYVKTRKADDDRQREQEKQAILENQKKRNIPDDKHIEDAIHYRLTFASEDEAKERYDELKKEINEREQQLTKQFKDDIRDTIIQRIITNGQEKPKAKLDNVVDLIESAKKGRYVNIMKKHIEEYAFLLGHDISKVPTLEKKVNKLIDLQIKEELGPIRKELEVIHDKYPTFKGHGTKRQTRRGGRIITSSISDLKKRLKILMGEVNAGNKKNPILKAEIAEIIDFLYQKKHLTREAHKAVTKMLSLHKFVMKK